MRLKCCSNEENDQKTKGEGQCQAYIHSQVWKRLIQGGMAVSAAALVIGIDEYATHPLSSAANDARAFKSALIDLGLVDKKNIFLMTAPVQDSQELPNRLNITKKLYEYYATGEVIDRFYFFFAGHGMSAFGSDSRLCTALIPKDLTDLKTEGHLLINFHEIRDRLSQAGPKEQFYFIDACRDLNYDFQPVVGPLGWAGGPPLGEMRSQTVLWAVKPLGTSQGVIKENGRMTSALLDALKSDKLAVEYNDHLAKWVVTMQSAADYVIETMERALAGETLWKKKYNLPMLESSRDPSAGVIRSLDTKPTTEFEIKIEPEEAANTTKVDVLLRGLRQDKLCLPPQENGKKFQLPPQCYRLESTSTGIPVIPQAITVDTRRQNSQLFAPKDKIEMTPEHARSVVAIEKRGPKIDEIEEIGDTYKSKLSSAGIKETEDLLMAAASRKGREELAKKTGINERLILEWVNLADVFRIKGISEEYSDLLDEVGVDTVAKLSRRNPMKLCEKMAQVKEEKRLGLELPSRYDVQDWVQQAKNLPRKDIGIGEVEASAYERETAIELESLERHGESWMAMGKLSKILPAGAYRLRFRLGLQVFNETDIYVKPGQKVKVSPTMHVTPLISEALQTRAEVAPATAEISESIGPIQAGILQTMLPIIGIKAFDVRNEMLRQFYQIVPPREPDDYQLCSFSLVVAVDGNDWRVPIDEILQSIKARLLVPRILPEEEFQTFILNLEKLQRPTLAYDGYSTVGGLERIRLAMLQSPGNQFWLEFETPYAGHYRLACAAQPNRATVVTLTLNPDGGLEISQNLLRFPNRDILYSYELVPHVTYGRMIRDLQLGQKLFESGELLNEGMVQTSIEALEDLLLAKWTDPVLSCMGYYAIRSSLETGKIQCEPRISDLVDRTARNLFRFFGTIPDSVIIYGEVIEEERDPRVNSQLKDQLYRDLLAIGGIPLLAESTRRLAGYATMKGLDNHPVVEIARRIPPDQIWTINMI